MPHSKLKGLFMMNAYSNCKLAVQDCVDTKYFTLAYLFSEEKTLDLHVHNCYEVYYSLSGAKHFIIGENMYDILPGDVFVINQFENHYVSVSDVKNERIVISIFPEFLSGLCSEQTDLSACFQRKGAASTNRIPLDKNNQQHFVRLCHKITGTSGYGADLIEKAALTEIMVLLNQEFSHLDGEKKQPQYSYNRMVNGVLQYINGHIDEELTIQELAKQFFVSESYICRIFKSETGTTINKYINSRRISIAKALLTSGASVTEACADSGFQDYVNFLKSFKKSVGMPPKQYSKMQQS